MGLYRTRRLPVLSVQLDPNAPPDWGAQRVEPRFESRRALSEALAVKNTAPPGHRDGRPGSSQPRCRDLLRTPALDEFQRTTPYGSSRWRFAFARLQMRTASTLPEPPLDAHDAHRQQAAPWLTSAVAAPSSTVTRSVGVNPLSSQRLRPPAGWPAAKRVPTRRPAPPAPPPPPPLGRDHHPAPPRRARSAR